MKFTTASVLALSLIVSACSSSNEKKNNVSDTSASRKAESKRVSSSRLENLTANWSQENKESLNKLVSKYGQPKEATSSKVVWFDNGEWTKTELTNDSEDKMLRQTASMKIPPEKLGEVSMYNKNIVVNQVDDTVTAISNREEVNYMILNLANEVVDGTISPYEARRRLSSMTGNTNRNYRNGLNFKNQNSNNQQSMEE